MQRHLQILTIRVFSRVTWSSCELVMSSFIVFLCEDGSVTMNSSRDRCSEDYLEIHDGPTADSPLIGRFCGNWIPDVTASGGHVFMVFVSGPATPPYGHVGFHGSLFGVSRGRYINCIMRAGNSALVTS